MAIQTVKTGAAVNDGTGDDARTAFTKINQNFTEWGNAASRQVGTGGGSVMEVGAFGLGGNLSNTNTGNATDYKKNQFLSGVLMEGNGYPLQYMMGYQLNGAERWQVYLLHDVASNDIWAGRRAVPGAPLEFFKLLTTANTQVDTSNGYIKGASPIIKLFTDKIELNDEAKLQDITFEKLGVGDYLIKGSTGFAQEGWYVETPKDANGNLLVAVVYEQLENGDISVKTYDYMLDNKGRIVADTETPLDIPEARWIDIRLQELPQPEFVPPVSNTPASFQPTGIAQAVSEMMNGTEQ